MIEESRLAGVLCDFARTMTIESPMSGIADQLVQRIVEVVSAARASLTLVASEGAAEFIAASDATAVRYERLQAELHEGPGIDAHATGETIETADLHADSRFPRFAGAVAADGVAAVFSFPLRHDFDRLGWMTLYSDAAGPLDPHDRAVAQTLAEVTAAYLVMARARDEARASAESLKQDALRDPLTGLPNRQLLEDRIEHAAEHARRTHTAAAVLFADLDQFKQVNDAHGHAAGDDLLVAVADRLSRLLRSSDTLARLSGDEFVLLCEDLGSHEDVDLIKNRIADAFSTPFTWPTYEVMITASVGVAYAGAGERISTHLVVEADKAMYEAKRSRCVH
ncbi:MAG: sensor domain-containing diguanylate cyclase [Ilumatobacteraceae bacterium]